MCTSGFKHGERNRETPGVAPRIRSIGLDLGLPRVWLRLSPLPVPRAGCLMEENWDVGTERCTNLPELFKLEQPRPHKLVQKQRVWSRHRSTHRPVLRPSGYSCGDQCAHRPICQTLDCRIWAAFEGTDCHPLPPDMGSSQVSDKVSASLTDIWSHQPIRTNTVSRSWYPSGRFRRTCRPKFSLAGAWLDKNKASINGL